MKELVGAFNQVKALVGAFFVIVKTDSETDGSSAALILYPLYAPRCGLSMWLLQAELRDPTISLHPSH